MASCNSWTFRISLSFFSFFCISIPHATPLSFEFNFSDPVLSADIARKHDATWNGTVINLTKDTTVGLLTNSSGQVYYNHPVPLWNRTTHEVASFRTSFSFVIQAMNPTLYGDGLAFFLSPFPPALPDFNGGGLLGLFENDSTALNPSANTVVAVEFDTYKNSWDPSDNHIGIDVNSISSTAYENWTTAIDSGGRATAWIDYDNGTNRLSVFLSYDQHAVFSGTFNLSCVVDLKAILPEEVAVGFSAATGHAIELHQILYWNFDSTLNPQNTSASSPAVAGNETKKHNSNALVASGLGAAGVGLLLCLVGVAWFLLWCKKAVGTKEGDDVLDEDEDDPIDDEFEKGKGPHRFPYSELVAATNTFDEAEKLGEGGFGSVYRGSLRGTNLCVAIKRISKGSRQGRKEYMSEVGTISQLRHRNLVQLIGWCHNRSGEFLLVYELMPNGSLDSYLYGAAERLLPWAARYNIAQGLASALFYLHNEWEQCVVHRDIKSSNVMLDSLFNAKLGDFGLARLIDHSRGSQTTVLAGTIGYLAPECFITGKASKESDIFSFGVVLLEIACGRKALEPGKVSLIEWVWDLYGRGGILEAADERLNGEFEQCEMECLLVVGLCCAHPDYNRRPSVKQAIGVLRFEIPLPALPPKMPVLACAPPTDLLNFNYTSSSAGASSGVVSVSTNSATASESSSSSRLK
ncbi:L-type lectin-domain containing receptor kinase IX.1-like [Ananas comosus]|uniref:non-specific serine/threonine protein kinase n=1 Tax=Ananas comosus TaxID=4615 RepID=A0A6P5H2M4_ANACO|nr:L-type lectin-domain containing receptor kinase IX.1-like [Ananas comosus]